MFFFFFFFLLLLLLCVGLLLCSFLSFSLSFFFHSLMFGIVLFCLLFVAKRLFLSLIVTRVSAVFAKTCQEKACLHCISSLSCPRLVIVSRHYHWLSFVFVCIYLLFCLSYIRNQPQERQRKPNVPLLLMLTLAAEASPLGRPCFQSKSVKIFHRRA